MQVTSRDPAWSCTAVELSQKADLGDSPEVDIAKKVFDLDAPLNLPGDAPVRGLFSTAEALPAVKQRVIIPWPNDPTCYPASTWFTLHAPMSIEEEEWSKFAKFLPLAPARTVVSSSLTLGKACVCFTTSCSSCTSKGIPTIYKILAAICMAIAARIGWMLKECNEEKRTQPDFKHLRRLWEPRLLKLAKFTWERQ